MGFLSKYWRILWWLLFAGLSTLSAQEQEEFPPAAEEEGVVFGAGPIPEVVRRPQRGESPRYPRDAVIGELGRGTAPEAAYRYARNCLAAVLANNQDSVYWSGFDAPLREEVFTQAGLINSRIFRLGGGREEPDGSVSFLFRLMGREQGIAGELYLRLEEEAWRLEDIILEEAQELTGKSGGYGFDFSPYERFF
jgi:hypothetical protein